MKLRQLIVCLCYYLFSLGCAIGAKSCAMSDKADPWPQIISFLTQGDPATPDVQVDLLKRNQNELKDIASVCATQYASEINSCYASHINTLNQASLSGFVQHDISADAEQLRKMQGVIDEIEAHPVTSSDAVHDFEDGTQIGFCFGRALMAHYLLLKADLQQVDMRKVFVIGELMVNRQMWNFHVAVMVRDSRSGWIVVDPLQRKPLSLSEWVTVMKSYDIKFPFSRTRFYVTDVRKFLPSSGVYDRDAFSHPSLRLYFDLLGHSLAL